MKKKIKKEENKKLYKNWKLYATALGALVIATGTGLGIYYGINTNHSEITKTNLNTIELNTTILSTKNITAKDALKTFLTANESFSDLKDNVKIASFIAPTYTSEGKLVVNAKTNSKYSGNITITIAKLAQTDLNTFGLNTIITGTEVIKNDETGQEAFNAFLTVNNSWSNLSDFVDYNSFTSSTYTNTGSLTITAKANTMFTGSVTITITKIEQTNLSTLELNTTIAVDLNATEDDVFKTFLEKNKNILDNNLNRNQVELSKFQQTAILKNGLLTITVKKDINSKYIGSIEIRTKYILNKTSISNVIHYLSDNALLHFSVRTGTPQDSNGSNVLSTLIVTRFREIMSGKYEYANDIQTIEINTYNQGPSQTDLNAWYYIWTTPSDFFIEIAIIYKNQPKEIIHIDHITATIFISTTG